jgi:hypothetical protein
MILIWIIGFLGAGEYFCYDGGHCFDIFSDVYLYQINQMGDQLRRKLVKLFRIV